MSEIKIKGIYKHFKGNYYLVKYERNKNQRYLQTL